jgi:hypothetical protein
LGFFLFEYGLFDRLIERAFDFSSTSFQIRFYNIVGNFKAFFEYPIFGAPVLETYRIRNEIMNEFTNIPYYESVNTLPMIFAYFGSFIGLFYTFIYLKFSSKITQSLFSTLLVFFAIFVSTSNVNLTSSILFTILPFLNYKE